MNPTPTLGLAILAAAGLAAACAGEPMQTHPAPGAVEHWTVQRDGYHLTLYPGFASRATLRAADGRTTELYRQAGSFRLPAGETGPAGRHRIVLRGGPHGRDVTVEVDDPRREVARIDVELYGPGHVPGAGAADAPAEVLTVFDMTKTCPPDCGIGEAKAPAAEATFFRAAAPFASAAWEARVGRLAGYEVSVDPGFASRAVVRRRGGAELELYRQAGVFRIPGGTRLPAGTHQVRLRGGPDRRDVALQVRDPRHQVAGLRIELYDPAFPASGGARPVSETVVVPNDAILCPPMC